MEPNTINATQLSPDGSGRVVALAHSGSLRQRLFDLGLIPGALIRRRYTAPTGTPIAFEVQGTIVALRRRDAEQVTVQEVAQAWTP